MKYFLLLVYLPIVFSSLRYISDNELKDFLENLLKNDVNNAGKLVKLSLQGKSKFNSTSDEAPNKLMELDKNVFKISTISKILPLYDNYDAEASNSEIVTPPEIKEETELLDVIIKTPAMELTKTLLQSKDMAPKTDEGFKNLIKDIWFTIYSRGGKKKGSSAFEHIFLGEFKKGQISGLHNWVYFDHLEKSKQLNYLGWIKKINFNNDKGGILKLKFAWKNVIKPSGSMFYGTSPEFEMAIYTVCFLARPNDKCFLSLNQKSFIIQTYSFLVDKTSVISSAYPTL